MLQLTGFLRYLFCIACALLGVFLRGSVNVAVAAQYDLAIDKTISTPTPYASGDIVTYQIRVENLGDTYAGSGVTVTDYLATGSEFTNSRSSSEPSVSLNGTTASSIEWLIPSIFPGESITIDYTVDLTIEGTHKNVADVRPGADDETEGSPAPSEFTTDMRATCTSGLDPTSDGVEAVSGTNNIDCVEISVSGSPADGACGLLTEAYDQEGNGDAINQGTPGLCGTGTVFAFSYNSSLHQWSWTCEGENGGEDADCSATELYCGDAVAQTGQSEQCDDGNQLNNDGCSESCQWELPVCFLATTGETYSGDSTQYSITGIDASWEAMVTLDYGDGSGEDSLTSGTYTYNHTYTSGGSYTGVLTVENYEAGTTVTGQCSELVTIGWCGDGVVNGAEQCDDGNTTSGDGCDATCQRELPACGLSVPALAYSGTSTQFSITGIDASREEMVTLDYGDGTQEAGLASGTYTYNHTYTSGGTYTGLLTIENYQASGTTLTGSCAQAVTVERCGDGEINGTEQCDDGNTTAGDGCDAACQRETPACTLSVVSGTYLGGTTTFSITGIDASWEAMITLDYGDGSGEDSLTSGTYSYDHTYLSGGAYTAVLTLENYEAGTSVTGQCSELVTIGRCGDGITNGDEQCDDGNSDNSDACTNSCENNVCQDGHVWVGIEQCDDGNATNTDACKNDCTANVCGDGVVEEGVEECDDGNATNGDGCSNACNREIPSCSLSVGTGIYSGNSTQFSITGIDVSREAMLSLAYGDGSSEAGLTSGTYTYNHTYTSGGAYTGLLTVDNYQASGSSVTGVCSQLITVGWCGDGIVNGGEVCDDGNSDNTDSCTNSCENAVCGDGYVQPGEACDDGNLINGDGCSDTCQVDSCGNGIVEPGEECDDGNSDNTDSCTNLCEDAVCGDGLVWSGSETCDDGNTTSGDGCNSSCQEEIAGVCGSLDGTGVYDADNNGDGLTGGSTDLCDTGGVTNFLYNSGTHSWSWECTGTGGAADASCTANELWCGDASVNGSESCDDGNNDNTDGCTNSCTVAICGDGFVQLGEQCDDGNTTSGDGCDASCAYESPSCSLTISNTTGTVPQTVTIDETVASGQTWIDETLLDWGDGQTATGPVFATSHTYTTTSAYYVDLTVESTYSGALTGSCTLLVEVGVTCGNGIQEAGESCDDGNLTGSDGCSAICQKEGCTDPTANNYDSGAMVDNGSCTTCGDGIVATGSETCDDGNTTSGDGCSASCQIEGCTDTSAHNYDPSAVVDDGSCRVCGDGVVDTADGEACDDGNNNDTDACTNSCELYTDYIRSLNRGGSSTSRGGTDTEEDDDSSGSSSGSPTPTTQSVGDLEKTDPFSDIYSREEGIKADYWTWSYKKKMILATLIERIIRMRMSTADPASERYAKLETLLEKVDIYRHAIE